MQYNQPLDQPSQPNASYIDGNPAAGIQGSIVPAASLEFDQREIIEVITRANARGYSDFSGTPCAVPANADLTQLRKAIEGFITSFQLIIDTTITFHVHGAGADFTDLNAAMLYLRKYYITTRGHVILQCGGAQQGATQAVQYIYTSTILFQHANNNRISVFGAPVLGLVPRTDTAYSLTGPSLAQRVSDVQINLAMLRTKFATEFRFVGCSGIQIGTSVPTLMDLDGFLLTSDGTGGAIGIEWLASFGWMNQGTNLGLAVVGFDFCGFVFELGCAVAIEGPGTNENTLSCLIAIGCGNTVAGCLIGDGSYLTMFGNVLCFNGGMMGFHVYPRGGCQMDGAVHSQCNNAIGIYCYLAASVYINGPVQNSAAYEPSHIWKNGQWGVWAGSATLEANIDCGAGTANANGSGSIWAGYGTNVHCNGGDLGISQTCSPAWMVVGNGNAWIGS